MVHKIGSVIPSWLVVLCLILSAASKGNTCSVPVFRYALERWPSDPYGLVVFHRGGLDEEVQLIIDAIDPDQRQGEAYPNLILRTVDLDQEPDESMQKLWKAQKNPSLPWMVVYYPFASGIRETPLSAPATPVHIQALAKSPLRQEIARRLIEEDSAVWVFLESGDAVRDREAARRLEDRLRHLEATLEIPTLEAEDIASGLVSVGQEELSVSFSMIRLSRDDPEEQTLTRMLLGMESDLQDLDEPMVFPVFGRGRVLYALVGAGINHETVDEAGRFLIGPCSCQVKDLNPGIDLLMSVDWDNRIEAVAFRTRDLPPLSGLGGMAPQDDPAVLSNVSDKGQGDDSSSEIMESTPALPAGGKTISRVILFGMLGLLGMVGFSFYAWFRK